MVVSLGLDQVFVDAGRTFLHFIDAAGYDCRCAFWMHNEPEDYWEYGVVGSQEEERKAVLWEALERYDRSCRPGKAPFDMLDILLLDERDERYLALLEHIPERGRELEIRSKEPFGTVQPMGPVLIYRLL